MRNRSVSVHHMLLRTVGLSHSLLTSLCIQLLHENNTTSIQSLSGHHQSGEHMALQCRVLSRSCFPLSIFFSHSFITLWERIVPCKKKRGHWLFTETYCTSVWWWSPFQKGYITHSWKAVNLSGVDYQTASMTTPIFNVPAGLFRMCDFWAFLCWFGLCVCVWNSANECLHFVVFLWRCTWACLSLFHHRSSKNGGKQTFFAQFKEKLSSYLIFMDPVFFATP